MTTVKINVSTPIHATLILLIDNTPNPESNVSIISRFVQNNDSVLDSSMYIESHALK
ncbi:MAG: hypothetical protein ACREA7_10295 [Nitrosotalea sp.]